MLRRFRCVIAENPLLGREPAPPVEEKRENVGLLKNETVAADLCGVLKFFLSILFIHLFELCGYINPHQFHFMQDHNFF